MFVVELDVGILYNESNVTTVYVDEGGGLPEAILCGVSPDTTGYNDALKLNWRRADKTPIPVETSPTSAISQNSNGQRKLYMKNVSVHDEGWYECEYTIPESNQTETKSVEILVNGAYSCFNVLVSIVIGMQIIISMQWTAVGVNGVLVLALVVLPVEDARQTVLCSNILEKNARDRQ